MTWNVMMRNLEPCNMKLAAFNKTDINVLNTVPYSPYQNGLIVCVGFNNCVPVVCFLKRLLDIEPLIRRRIQKHQRSFLQSFAYQTELYKSAINY